MADRVLLAADSTSGWSLGGGITAEACGHADLIASGHAASVAFRIPEGSSGMVMSVLLPEEVSLSGYDRLSISVASLRTERTALRRMSDAQYSVRFDDAPASEYYFTCGPVLSRVAVPAPSSAKRLAITVRHGGEDFLVISDFRASSDELPGDILSAVASSVEAERDRLLGEGIEIGTATASVGDRRVTVDTDWEWVVPGCMLSFEYGVGLYERHQVATVEDNVVTFNTMLDGASTLNVMLSSRVRVAFPVTVGYYDREAALPGVSVWCEPAEPIERHSRATMETAAIRSLSGTVRHVVLREGMLVSWRVTLEAAARDPDLLAVATRAVRAFLAASTVWVHGLRLWFEWREPAAGSEPVEGYEIVPRETYSFAVEVKEDSWAVEEAVPGVPDLSVSLSL